MRDRVDPIVIFHSPEDGCWLAHSLETDQIGDGESVLEALESVLRGLELLHAEADADPTIRRWRKAPQEIVELYALAKPCPDEIVDVASKRVHGKWPSEIDPIFGIDDAAGPFATHKPELVTA